MQFSTLLLPILGGAIYCRTSYRFRYRFYRRRGYELFFTAATAGAVLLTTSFLLLHSLASVECLHPVKSLWNEATPNIPWLATFALPVVLAAPVAHLIDFLDEKIAEASRKTWFYENWWWPFYTEYDVRLDEIDAFGTELELLAYEAVEVLDSVVRRSGDGMDGSASVVAPKYMITLESGKVFIGIITSAPDPVGEGLSYLKMIKVASGHRTESYRVKIDTRYDKYFPNRGKRSDISGKEDVQDKKVSLRLADFEVTVALDKMVHITPFDTTVDGPDDWPMT